MRRFMFVLRYVVFFSDEIFLSFWLVVVSFIVGVIVSAEVGSGDVEF